VKEILTSKFMNQEVNDIHKTLLLVLQTTKLNTCIVAHELILEREDFLISWIHSITDIKSVIKPFNLCCTKSKSTVD